MPLFLFKREKKATKIHKLTTAASKQSAQKTCENLQKKKFLKLHFEGLGKARNRGTIHQSKSIYNIVRDTSLQDTTGTLVPKLQQIIVTQSPVHTITGEKVL